MPETQAAIYQQFYVISPLESACSLRVLITAAIWMAQVVKDSKACACLKPYRSLEAEPR